MNFGPGTRTLQFSSLGFDASIAEILTTLAYGGCVYVPNEEQRLSNIAGVINQFQVNWAFFTSTVISLLEPSHVPSLKTLVLGGEAVKSENINVWADKIDLVNGYGSTETCVFCVSATLERSNAHKKSTIGRAIGSAAWVVSLEKSQLATVGSVGELWIEGPQLARGYLSNDEATAAAFVVDPPFLQG